MEEQIKEYREIYNSCWKLFMHVCCAEKTGDGQKQMQKEAIEIAKNYRDSPFMKKLLYITIEELCDLFWNKKKSLLGINDLEKYRDTYFEACNLLTNNLSGFDGSDEKCEVLQDGALKLYESNPKKMASNFGLLVMDEVEKIYSSDKKKKVHQKRM